MEILNLLFSAKHQSIHRYTKILLGLIFVTCFFVATVVHSVELPIKADEGEKLLLTISVPSKGACTVKLNVKNKAFPDLKTLVLFGNFYYRLYGKMQEQDFANQFKFIKFEKIKQSVTEYAPVWLPSCANVTMSIDKAVCKTIDRSTTDCLGEITVDNRTQIPFKTKKP